MDVPVHRPIVPYRTHHNDVIRQHLPHFLYEWKIHVVGAANAQIKHMDATVYRIVEGIEEPRCVRH